ncbi:MAG: adenylosuccinate synthase [Armatimonadota bacterium]|nr:adenylosuccinate synthase [Armatimonadota bacterium]
MPAVVVVGAQWGDEAKGKVVDCLAQDADMVVRYGGGSNAGHTVRFDGQEFKLHLVPSGIFRPEVTNIIAGGVVVDPKALVEELRALQAKGVDTRRLYVSARAHVVMPYHRIQDALEEKQRGASQIGTTCRGIGPAYADKAARKGIRMADLLHPERFSLLLRQAVEEKSRLLRSLYDADCPSYQDIWNEYTEYASTLRPLVTDTDQMVYAAVKSGQRVVFEGAQGTLLDLDYGTYPYVTSSHPVAGGACLGTGIGPTQIDAVVGVAKAYTTRVGSGAFPTEQANEVGNYLRERGREYGTTTGRPRRCGWLDAVVLRYSAQVNGLTAFAMTLLDVLSGLETLYICRAYRLPDGQTIEHFPADGAVLEQCEPVYEQLPGWKGEIGNVSRWEELPSAAQGYIQKVEELTGVPVAMVSVGPWRTQTLWRHGVSAEAPVRTLSSLTHP